jgi:sec-independent protein translocase protein TatA
MIEGFLQPTHLLLFFFIALLVFGPQKIPDLEKSLGESIREFKKTIAQDDERAVSAAETPEQKSELTRLP